MVENIANELLPTYGPWTVFFLLMLSGFGFAVGEDIITIPAGAFIASGHLGFWPTAVLAYLGVVLSDCMWFFICSRYGTPLLHRRWFKRLVHPRRLLQAKHQFEEHGMWIVVVARFIPSSRTTAITAAGILRMPFLKFALATASCVLVTVPLQLGLGYWIGKGIGTEDTAQLLLRIIGLVVLIGAAMVVINAWQGWRSRKKRVPRARMSWLRRKARG